MTQDNEPIDDYTTEAIAAAFTPQTYVATAIEGHSLMVATCRTCGAAVLLDVMSDVDPIWLHMQWHAASASEPATAEADEEPWAVYEHEHGGVWSCKPPTRENAEEEARLAGFGHEAMPLERAKAMSNAWAMGRFKGIDSMRSEEAR